MMSQERAGHFKVPREQVDKLPNAVLREEVRELQQAEVDAADPGLDEFAQFDNSLAPDARRRLRRAG